MTAARTSRASAHRAAILAALAEPGTRRDVAARTGLPPTTVCNHIIALAKAGAIRVVAPARRGRAGAQAVWAGLAGG